MVAQAKDDWQKPRNHGQHLTEEEMAAIRVGYRTNRAAKDVARELQCSTRTVNRYYGILRAEGETRHKIPPPTPKATAPAKSRFYKSTFEL